MKPLLPALSLAVAIVTLAACNDATPPADAPSATPPVADAPPADAATPPPGDGDVGVPPVDDDLDDNDADDDAVATIPASFQGEWNTDAAACGSGSNESRLVISADTMRFYESSGPVQSASVDGNELTVVVRLTGEGETREATYRFRLSADGRTLTDADSALARQRCE